MKPSNVISLYERAKALRDKELLEIPLTLRGKILVEYGAASSGWDRSRVAAVMFFAFGVGALVASIAFYLLGA